MKVDQAYGLGGSLNDIISLFVSVMAFTAEM